VPILVQYKQSEARIRTLQAVPEEEWAQRFLSPREEILTNLRNVQRSLFDQLRAAGVIPREVDPGREDGK
jgi:hypothetical protein